MILYHWPCPPTPPFIKTVIQASLLAYEPATPAAFALISHIEVQSLAWTETQCACRGWMGGVGVVVSARPWNWLISMQAHRADACRSVLHVRAHANKRARTHAHTYRSAQRQPACTHREMHHGPFGVSVSHSTWKHPVTPKQASGEAEWETRSAEVWPRQPFTNA